MATATLETLEIEIKHSASGAADEINNVATAIRALNDSLKGIVPKLTKLAGALGAIKGGRRDLTFNISDNSTRQFADTINNIKESFPRAEKATKGISNGFSAIGAAAKKAIAPVSGFFRSIGRIAFYRLIRSMLKAITQAFSEGLKNAYLFSQGIEGEGHRFAEAMDAMKSASTKMKSELGAAFLGLLTALMPVLLQLISLVTKAANAINQLIAAFTGTTYLKAKDVTEQWADNTAKGAKAAKEWRNQLLGFDEINRLDEPNKGGGGGSTGLDPSQMFEDSPIEDWVLKIHNSLAAIELMAGEFELALGLILTLTGANIPLGIGLIAVGAYHIVHALTENWNTIPDEIARVLSQIMEIVGGGLVGVGLILALTGANLPLGIGLIVAGLGMIGTGVAIDWNSTGEKVRSVLSGIMLALGGMMAAAGIILLLATPTFSAIGLGLLAAGAITLGAGAAVLNWDWVQNKLKGTLGELMATVGLFVGVLGVILLCSGNIPWGLGLTIAGAAAFGSAIAANWNAIKQFVASNLTTILQIIGTTLAAVGVILLCSGFIPLGIGLLVAGAAALGAAAVLNWDAVKEKVFNVLGIIMGIVGTMCAAVGVILLLTGNIPLGVGMIVAGVSSMYASYSLSNSIRNLVDSLFEYVMGKIIAVRDFILGIAEMFKEWADSVVQWINDVTSGPTSADNSYYVVDDTFGVAFPGMAASGGQFDTGELFIAREAGPEMVGTIGGKTSVANNDQIVEALRAGVYDGVSAAMSGNSGATEVRVYLDSREIRAGQQRLARSMGV